MQNADLGLGALLEDQVVVVLEHVVALDTTLVVVVVDQAAHRGHVAAVLHHHVRLEVQHLDVVSAGALGLAEPEETGTTFVENAVIKAHAAAAVARPKKSPDC